MNYSIYMKDRVILHCDCNSFFASVETALDPSYKDVPMAVCGSKELRHGIVLAKSEEAKKYAKQLDDAEAAQERNAKAIDDLNLKILNQDTAVKNATAEIGKYESALDNLDKANEDAANGFDKTGKSAEEATKGGLNAF